MKYVLSIIVCIAFWLAPSCTPSHLVNVVQAKNPSCSVTNVEESGSTVKVTLACPYGQSKTVVMHEKH